MSELSATVTRATKASDVTNVIMACTGLATTACLVTAAATREQTYRTSVMERQVCTGTTSTVDQIFTDTRSTV